MNLFQSHNKSPIASSERFRELYEQNRLPVFRYIYGLTGGPQEDVEDLAAETFLRAWKSRHQFEGDLASATGWLIRIAKRLVIDDYRHSIVQATYSVLSDPPTGSQPEQTAQENEETQIMFNLLAELPDAQREILVLRYFLGWKVNEIAQHTGMTENHVSVTIHRILARLREKWQENEQSVIPMLFVPEENIP